MNNDNNFSAIKQAEKLIEKKNWVCFKFKERENGKRDKIPYSPHNQHSPLCENNPSDWENYEVVRSAKGFDGIGIKFDGTFLGVDMDNVLESGTIRNSQAQEFLAKANTYIEVSPSGNGLHLFFLLNEEFNPIKKVHKTGEKSASGDTKFEYYTEGRFFTFTGNNWSTSQPIRTINKKEAEVLLEILGYPKNTQNVELFTKHKSNKAPEEVLNELLSEEKYRNFYLLNDTEKENDTSSADMSMMCKIRDLADGDINLMREVFQMTPRANRKKVSERTDYLDLLIKSSLNYSRPTNIYENEKQENPSPKVLTISELYDTHNGEVEWTVEDLLIRGGLSIVASKPKVGKSTLIRQMLSSVAKGEYFLGKKSIKGYALYISLEEPGIMVKKYFKDLGINKDENFIGVVSDTFLPPNPISWLESVIQEKNPSLIVIDTIGHFVGEIDFNDYSKMIKVLTPLLKLARHYKTHITVIHHARKGDGQDGDIILGSTGILSIVDTAIFIKKDTTGNRIISTQQRYGTDTEPTHLVFNKTSQELSLGDSKKQNSENELQESILDYLETNSESKKEGEILEYVGGNTKAFRTLLRKLVSENRIVKIGRGTKTDPFLYTYLDKSGTDTN
jgi:hypothetical protein